jgi:hypothetical protein
MFARADLERLLHFRSQEAPVVSLYVAFPKEQGLRGMRARLHSILKPVQDLADSDELPHASRLMDQAHDAVVAIVDTKNAWLFTYSDGDVREVGKRHEALLDKRKRAAWHGPDEHSMWNREDTWARKHLTETAKRIEDLMQQTGAEVVVVGGQEETIPEFVALLGKTLPSKLAGRFAIDTGNGRSDAAPTAGVRQPNRREPLLLPIARLRNGRERSCVRPREHASGAGSPDAWQAKV